MKQFKKIVFRILFASEIILFSCYYLLGRHGLPEIISLQKQNKEIELSIEKVKQEVANLENELLLWNTDSFYKEKIAREQLQMAYPNERLYRY